MSCDCTAIVQSTEVPGKVIVLKCTRCETEYVLYPNGQITYEQKSSGNLLIA